jgi:hypothetical protein
LIGLDCFGSPILGLNFGKLGFRRPKAAIKLKLAIQTIIERLRLKKMHSCIRTID